MLESSQHLGGGLQVPPPPNMKSSRARSRSKHLSSNSIEDNLGQGQWIKKTNKNRQLLIMMNKIKQSDSSSFAKYFRFQKLQPFLNFEHKFKFKQIVRFRLDDLIYLALLVIVCIVFAAMVSKNSADNVFANALVDIYHTFLIFLVIFSAIWLISTNGLRHWVFVLMCIAFPAITFIVYQRIVPFDVISPDTTIFTYLKILILVVVYFGLYLAYPLKQFVRNKVGSLYSYFYALSILTLVLIWPLYSLIVEFSQNQQITFTFITQNRPLLITFIVIIVFTFHLLTHHTLFEGNLKQTSRILLLDYEKSELAELLEELEIQIQRVQNQSTKFQQQKQNPKAPTSPQELIQSIARESMHPLYQNYTLFTRIMSFLVFCFTCGMEIYIFDYLTNNISEIFQCLGLMFFCVGFLVYGCIINIVPISRQLTLYLFSLLSLVPAIFSPLYCNTCSQFTFFQYIFLLSALPYSTIFWCVVRSLSKHKPFLKISILLIMYVLVNVPLTIFILNSLGMVTENPQTLQIVNYVVLGMVGLVSFLGFCGFIGWLASSVAGLQKPEGENETAVNYNYHEDGNPAYIPYIKKQSFSLAWLATLDIRNLTQLFNCIIFILCELSTFYCFNLIRTAPSQINLPTTNTANIVFSQFFNSFAFFTFGATYIGLKYDSIGNYLVLISLIVVGIALILFAYLYEMQISFMWRLNGIFSIVLACIGFGLYYVKVGSKDIINFISGILIILIWILTIIPYTIVLPTTVLFLDEDSHEGPFIFYCILFTTLLLILIVSILSFVFNVLMNKFEAQKKIKFITEDVEVYLKEEGIYVEDQILHVMYESYQYRDEKYVFFMKRGYPVRLHKDLQQENLYTAVVYNNDILDKKLSLEKTKVENKGEDCFLSFLTCCCGVDDDEIEGKMKQVNQMHIIREEEMEQLVPHGRFKDFIKKQYKNQTNFNHKTFDLTKFYSSKSFILKNLTPVARHTGQQYAILKTKKNKRLAIQVWHTVFNFIANQDSPPAKLIFNDFILFCQMIKYPEWAISPKQMNELFVECSNSQWKQIHALDIEDFSLMIQILASRRLKNQKKTEQSKYNFLIQLVYPNMCNFAEFQDVVNERRGKKTKFSQLVHNDSAIQNEGKHSNDLSQVRKYQNSTNLFLMSEEENRSSPFMNSFQKYKDFQEKLLQKEQKMLQMKISLIGNRIIIPAEEQVRKAKVEVIKTKSCKKRILQKYHEIKLCCSCRKQQEDEVIKRQKVKPWQYLSVEAIRIMEQKQQEWKEQKQEKQYEFRPILNNILIAVFKIADLYTYMEITIMNPEIGWQNIRSFSILLIQYKYQLYIAFALVLICAGMGLKGIQYIFQDRLGLTVTRIPAAFPHPMFFFTFIYKLFILSFFNTVIMTLLSTFVCNWMTSQSNVFYMIVGNAKLQCFGTEQTLYAICSLLAIVIYYPLSAYTMPNFQFAEKRLDLKYKPTYLIIYFQANFMLAAGKVLLSQAIAQTQLRSIEILFQSLNIFCLLLLTLCIILMKPCLITWFNVIDFLVVWVSLIWNCFGLVLYLTDLWLFCILISSGLSIASIALGVIFVRKVYFRGAQVHVEADHDQIGELQKAWEYKKGYKAEMVKHQNCSLDKELNDPFEIENSDHEKVGNKNRDSKARNNSVLQNNLLSIQNDDAVTNFDSFKILPNGSKIE